jgi:ribosomal protein S18 acetylase RimI-like enzyme
VPSGETPPTGNDLPIRELRRSDRVSFLESIVGGYGPFEEMIGLARDGSQEFDAVFRPGLWMLLRFLRLIGRAPVRAFVVADGGPVVATTLLLPWPRSGYILGVGVRPAYRRRGLARRLVAHAEEVAHRSGRAWAVLDVEEENLPAVALYQARDYVTLERSVWWKTDAPDGIGKVAGGGAAVRPLRSRAERTAAATWVARHVSPEVSTPLPPTGNRLTHLESLGQTPGSAREVWEVGPSGARLGIVTGIWRGASKPGILFVPALESGISRSELVSVIQTAVAWLGTRGSAGLLLALPDSFRAASPVLEELGFRRQLSTLAMARPLAVHDGGAPPPKNR